MALAVAVPVAMSEEEAVSDEEEDGVGAAVPEPEDDTVGAGVLSTPVDSKVGGAAPKSVVGCAATAATK